MTLVTSGSCAFAPAREGKNCELFHGFTRLQSRGMTPICRCRIGGGDVARHYNVIAAQDHVVAECFCALWR